MIAQEGGGLADPWLLSGEFDIGFAASPEDIMSLYLAIDAEIVHVIYWHRHGEAAGVQFRMDTRIFPLPSRLLARLSSEEPCPVYVVLAATDDFFAYAKEYSAEPKRADRILIGHISRLPGR